MDNKEQNSDLMGTLLLIAFLTGHPTKNGLTDNEIEVITERFQRFPKIWEKINNALELRLYCTYATDPIEKQKAELKLWKLQNQ